MEGFSYFPATIYRDEQPELINDILPFCTEHISKFRRKGQGLTQTALVNNEPCMEKAVRYLLSSSINILKWQGYIVEKYEFYIKGLWVQELQRGSSTDVHFHSNSQICGWMFLDAPVNGAYPVFYDTRLNKAMIELDSHHGPEVTNATRSIHFNNVLPGTVILGNSWIQHQLLAGTSELPTRCIHFIISHRELSCSTY